VVQIEGDGAAKVMPWVIDGGFCSTAVVLQRIVRQTGGDMNIKLAALAALLLAPGQATAEDVRVDCVTDQRIVCRDDETTCRAPVRSQELVTYHFTFDLTKKTGSLVYCSYGISCMELSPLTVLYDWCAFLRDYGAGCLSGHISVWEPSQQQTYTISDSRYVMTASVIADHSVSVTEFGHCAVQ
jgi:hypothetical protein